LGRIIGKENTAKMIILFASPFIPSSPRRIVVSYYYKQICNLSTILYRITSLSFA